MEKTMKSIRCGMAQLFTEGGEREKNLARAEDLIMRAAEEECDVVVLPECCDLGWTHPSASELAAAVPGGESCERLAQAALRNSIHVVAGIVERDGGRCYNTAVLIDPKGNLAAKSRKINVLTIAQPYYAIGDRLAVGHTSLGAIGLDICADNFANCLAIGDVLCRMGAEVILSPCSWADDAEGVENYRYNVDFWIGNYARIAKHYRVPVVGVSNVGVLTEGPWAGKQVVGCSVAVGPDGSVLAQCRTGWTKEAEELRVIDLPISARETRGTDIAGIYASC
jgi:predicted amidohydrolase